MQPDRLALAFWSEVRSVYDCDNFTIRIRAAESLAVFQYEFLNRSFLSDIQFAAFLLADPAGGFNAFTSTLVQIVNFLLRLDESELNLFFRQRENAVIQSVKNSLHEPVSSFVSALYVERNLLLLQSLPVGVRVDGLLLGQSE